MLFRSIIEQTLEAIKVKTADGSVFVFQMAEVERIVKEEVPSPASGKSAGMPRQLAATALVFNPLGFLQFGPILDFELRVLPDLLVLGHFRYHSMGVISHVIQDQFGSELKMNSIALGAGMRYLFPLSASPNRPYLGFLLENCWAHYIDNVDESDELEGTNTLFIYMVNGGYRWRFADGFLLGVGGYVGQASTLSDTWNYTQKTGSGTGAHVKVFYAALELSLGIEL